MLHAKYPFCIVIMS